MNRFYDTLKVVVALALAGCGSTISDFDSMYGEESCRRERLQPSCNEFYEGGNFLGNICTYPLPSFAVAEVFDADGRLIRKLIGRPKDEIKVKKRAGEILRRIR
jgi:hypothetical protein